MNRDDEIFADAVTLATADRAAHLDRVCRDDPELRARIEALLANHVKAQAYFERPLVNSAHLIANEEQPGNTIARYTLREKIGEGGCGVVWLAEQSEPVRRRVALKVIKLGMDTKEVIARFEAERQALALMDHPNIARVFDGGTTETGRPFFVMELVRGVPITRYCDEANLTPPQRLELFIAVCQAVQHAHHKGVVHRDLKPSNILVSTQDGVATPKVIDFGIAKATHGRLTDHTLFTAFQQFIGTPAYMSPEQAEFSSAEIDERSDIYSLGVLLYELLTGEPPFDQRALARAGLDEIRRQIRETEPSRPSARFGSLHHDTRSTIARQRGIAPAQLSSTLRGDLDWIVMRCLEKSRARRYESAAALAADLQHHLAHEPVTARPPSFGYKAGKFARRHRIGLAGVALLLVGMALSTAVAVKWIAPRPPAAVRLAAATKPSEVQSLIAQARTLYERWDLATAEDRALAEQLLKKATDLDPLSADAWAAWSLLASCEVVCVFDTSPERKVAARALAERAIKLGPELPQPRFAWAMSRRFTKETAGDALPLLLAERERQPENQLLARTVGRALADAGRFEESRACLEQVVAREPSDPIAAANLGMTLFKLRRPAEAEAQFDRALALAPRYLGARAWKLHVLLYYRRDVPGAEAQMELIPAELLTTETGALFATSMHLYCREPRKALLALQRVRDFVTPALGGFHGPKTYWSGVAHTLLGNVEAARTDWQTALRLVEQQQLKEPAAENWIEWRAYLLALLGRKEEAEALAKEIRQRQSSRRQPGAPTGSARLEVALGHYEEAITLLEWELAGMGAVEYGVMRRYNDLRYLPEWDPLRGNARFEARLNDPKNQRAAVLNNP